MGTQLQFEPEQRGKPAMNDCIPAWAKQVREVLGQSGPMPLANVARRIADATTNEVAMAVGWLAHAGEIRFRRRGALWEIQLQ
jgi:hypothetical protein